MEQFKNVVGYEGLYKISNKGNVFSVINNKLLNKRTYHTNNTSYQQVALYKDSVKKYLLVHRLVAQAFLENPLSKPCVNHIDNNGSNNSLENLEWCTYSENLIHAQKQGRLTEAQSKGGKATIAILKEKALEEALSMVGQTYGTLKVLEYLGLSSVGTKGIERHNFKCKCSNCGNVKEITREQLKVKPSCRGCDLKNKTEKQYLLKKKELENTVVANWKILEMLPPKTTMKTSVLLVECTECGSTNTLPYPAVNSSRPLKKCPICKVKDNDIV
jgi:hypothetical protein